MAGTPSLFAGIGGQLFDNNGNPLSGGKVFTYLGGTTTPVATYTTESASVAHTNPIILDSAGRVPSGGEIWLKDGDGTSYKFVVKTSTDVVIATYDNVPGTYSSGDLANTTDVNKGDALVGFRQSNTAGLYTGAVGRTVHDKLQEWVSIRDFGAVGDGSTNDTAAIQAAIDAVAAGAGSGGVVTIPPSTGSYIFTQIIVKTGVTLLGTGGVLKLKDNVCVNPATAYYLIHNLTYTDVTYDSLIIDGNRANNTSYLVADAITATGVNVIVRNCRILNTPDSGIMFSDAPNGLCVNNWIDTGGDLGIYVNAADVMPRVGQMTVSGNTIKNFPYGGIGVKRSTNSTIVSNNMIYSCGNGITVEDFGSGNHPDHLIITGNLMKDIGFPYKTDPLVAQWGIVLNACTNVVVTSNKVQNVSGYGLVISGTTQSVISDNHFTGYPTDPKVGSAEGVNCDVRSGVTPSQLDICGNIFRDFTEYGGKFLALEKSIVNNNIFQSADTAIRLYTACTTNTFSLNVFDGTIADTSVPSTVVDNIWVNNRYVHGAVAWSKDGNVYDSSNPTPITFDVPKYAGQLALVTYHGPRVYMSTGLTINDWVQISANMDFRTAAELLDITQNINTIDKYTGKTIWDTTNNRVMVASGPAAGARWYVCDGSAFITPV